MQHAELGAPLSGFMLDRFNRVCEALTDAFGAEFSIVDEYDMEYAIGPESAAALSGMATGAAVAVEGASQQLEVFLCMNAVAAGRLFAHGACRLADETFAVKLAQQVYANVLQGEQIEEVRSASLSYVNQVTHDFEELCWLRSLAQGLEFCHAASEVTAVTQSVLPSLCQLIYAETLAVVPVVQQTKNTDPRQPPAAPVIPPYQCGTVRLSEADIEQVARRFAPECVEQPRIFNSWSSDDALPKCVRSCVVVAIRHHEQLFGHLVAINRLAPPEDLQDNLGFEATSPEAEREFGTIEATLLGTAAVMLATHASNVQLFRDKEQLLIGVIRALINAMDAKDSYTCGHSDRVALVARRLAEEVGLDAGECERIYMAGLLHDIGKIGVPDEVLTKPGKLTDEEFDQIKRHPAIGFAILRHVKQLEFVLPGVLHHHEMINGRGYPHALSGEEIPLFGRILAVADAYDAMTSCRPYRQAMPSEKAERILREGAGTQWDAKIIECFFAALPDILAICSRAEEHTADILAGADDIAREYTDSVSTAVAAMNVTR